MCPGHDIRFQNALQLLALNRNRSLLHHSLRTRGLLSIKCNVLIVAAHPGGLQSAGSAGGTGSRLTDLNR